MEERVWKEREVTLAGLSDDEIYPVSGLGQTLMPNRAPPLLSANSLSGILASDMQPYGVPGANEMRVTATTSAVRPQTLMAALAELKRNYDQTLAACALAKSQPGIPTPDARRASSEFDKEYADLLK